MTDITVLVNKVLEVHKESAISGNCVCGSGEFPCPEKRIASDWQRMRQDLCKAWRNRTGKEIFVVRKFACAVCSEKDTGLICVECIADAQRGEDFESKEAVIEEMANNE
jgi:hypothetical protein